MGGRGVKGKEGGDEFVVTPEGSRHIARGRTIPGSRDAAIRCAPDGVQDRRSAHRADVTTCCDLDLICRVGWA